MARILRFSITDFVIFGLTLAISCAIGVFYALKKQSSNEYLTASGSLPLLPTALSLMSSFVSGISLLSFPAEIYSMGVVTCWTVLGTCLALVLVAFVMLPSVKKVKGLSMYNYFEERFGSKLLKFYGTVLFTLATLLWASVAIYAPSVSLAGVSGVPIWIMVLSMGAVCSLYTTVGGLKAVIWTDTFQALVMYGGLIALVIKGTLNSGGISGVVKIANDHGRLYNIFNVDPNPFQYMTLWTALFGGCVMWIGHFGSNQVAQQRYRSMPTLSIAQTTVLINIPLLVIIYFLIYYSGLAMFAYYSECDPVKAEFIDNKDQLTVYFMLDIFYNITGLPGLMLACICSSTLSTVSSCIHAMATVFNEAFVNPHFSTMSENRSNVIIKIIAFAFGLTVTGLAFACEALGGVFVATNKALGAMEGPLSGLLLLGMVIPWSNKIGGIVGVVIGSVTASWLFIGATVTQDTFTPLPVSINGCNQSVSNFSIKHSFNATTIPTNRTESGFNIYHHSSLLYPVIGMTLVLLIGSVVSALANLIFRKTVKFNF